MHDEQGHVPQEEERRGEDEHAGTPGDEQKQKTRQNPREDHELDCDRKKEQTQRDERAVFFIDGQRQSDAARRVRDCEKKQGNPHKKTPNLGKTEKTVRNEPENGIFFNLDAFSLFSRFDFSVFYSILLEKCFSDSYA
jgi:hypothetical protein